MVYGDGLFKPSLLIFSVFFDKLQLYLSDKQAIYGILDTPEFAVEPLELAAEPPKFTEEYCSGCCKCCQKIRKSDGSKQPSPETITPQIFDIQYVTCKSDGLWFVLHF